jgi:hypothetical protein
MGLLDNFNLNDPMLNLGMGLLSAGGPSRTPTSFGQALVGGMQGMLSAQQRQQLAKEKEQEMLVRKMQIDKAKQEMADSEALRNFDFSQYIQTPQQQALAGGHGPTPQAAAMIPQLQPKIDQQGMVQGLLQSGNPALRKQGFDILNKEDETVILPEGGSLIKKRNGSVVAQGQPKRESLPEVAKLQSYLSTLPPGDPRRADVVNAINKATTHQPTTTVNVQPDNLGLKPKDRFDMEDKLRADYSKTTELDSKLMAHSSKLKAILSGDPSAMKDQSAIYTFAKLLDPDGAVRESDYAAIMNTAGIGDRIRNYLTHLQSGQMLSPAQRADMENVLTQFESVAQRNIGAAQKRFGANAKMYNLTPENIFNIPTSSNRPPLSSFGG